MTNQIELPNPKICYDATVTTSHGYREDNVYHYGEGDIERLKSGLQKFGLSWLHGCWTELAIVRHHNLLDGNQASFLERYKQELFAANYADRGKATAEYEAMCLFFDDTNGGRDRV